MSKRIKKTLIPQNQSSGIRSTKLKPNGISFSFKYFRPHHDKFSCRDREISYWLKLLDRLKDLSALTTIELIQNGSDALRCHQIDWDDTTEEGFGIPGEDLLVLINLTNFPYPLMLMVEFTGFLLMKFSILFGLTQNIGFMPHGNY